MIKKIGLLLLFSVFATNCVHKEAQRKVASSEKLKPRHFVITVHGVRGNYKSFGDFNKYIKIDLENIDPTYRVIPITSLYQVADPDFDTYKTANVLNAEIICSIMKANEEDGIDNEIYASKRFDDKLINELNRQTCFLGGPKKLPTILPEDKFSMVAYSMGGQVGMAWFYSNLFGDNAYLRQFSEKLQVFYSLGSPFWGSIQASWGVNSPNEVAATLKDFDLTAMMKKQFDSTALISKNSKEKIIDSLDSTGIIKYYQAAESIVKDIAKYTNAQGYLNNFSSQLKSMTEEEWTNKLAQLPGLNLSGHEISALSTLSDTTYKLRQDHLRFAQELNKFPNVKTKFISLAGLFNCYNGEGEICDFKPENVEDLKDRFVAETLSKLNKSIIKQHFFGYTRHESDMVVIVPSANADFYFYKDPENSSVHNITSNLFKKTNESLKQSGLLLKETIHATVDNGKYVNDMVITNDNCAEADTCKNPTFAYVVNSLANCETEESSACNKENIAKFRSERFKNSNFDKNEHNELYKDIFGFNLEFNIRLPLDYDESKIRNPITNEINVLDLVQFPYNKGKELLHDGMISPEYFSTNANSGKRFPYYLQVARNKEWGSTYAKVVLNKATNEKHLRIIITGRYRPQLDNNADKCDAIAKNADERNLDASKGSLATRIMKCNANIKKYQKSAFDKTHLATLDGTTLPFALNIPGYTVRNIEAKIQRGYSTYIDLNMN